jgi:hypothetical protein
MRQPLLCWRHHHDFAHHSQWYLKLLSDATVEGTRPDGTIVTSRSRHGQDQSRPAPEGRSPQLHLPWRARARILAPRAEGARPTRAGDRPAGAVTWAAEFVHFPRNVVSSAPLAISKRSEVDIHLAT